MTLIETGTVAHTVYTIYENGGKYVVFIGGCRRATKATLKGAQGVVAKIRKAN